MISSWYVPYGFCFPFGLNILLSINNTKRKELGIIQKVCLKRANHLIGVFTVWQNVMELSILIFLRYSYKNLIKKYIKW